MRSLTLDTGGAPTAVRIVADREAREPRADLRRVTNDRSDRARLSITTDADGTQLQVDDTRSGFMVWGDPGEITVTVPPELGRRLAVTVRQDTGVLMADADLDQLTSSTTDGAVLLRGTVRRVEVRARDGEVRVRAPISVTESFTAETRDGDIDVSFADTPQRIDATTRDGDISIALPPPGPYLVRAQSRAGAGVRVPETRDPRRAAAEVTADSRDGDVSIETLR
jgi:hypothetical protein